MSSDVLAVLTVVWTRISAHGQNLSAEDLARRPLPLLRREQPLFPKTWKPPNIELVAAQ
jgi:hypothetical protein